MLTKAPKIKTYILIVSKCYPDKHILSGETTGFLGAISSGTKKHTIRANYDLWQKRISEINENKAILSLRTWSRTPYRSEQWTWWSYNGSSNIGIEKVKFKIVKGLLEVAYPKNVTIKQLAKNDGLTVEAFRSWFKDVDVKKTYAIIHLTKFRYGKKSRSTKK